MVQHTILPLSHIICEKAIIWSRYSHSRCHLALILSLFAKSVCGFGNTLPLRKSRHPLQIFIEIIYKLSKQFCRRKQQSSYRVFVSAPKLKASPRVWFDNYIWPVCRRKNWYFMEGIPLKSKKSKSPSILWKKYLKNYRNRDLARIQLNMYTGISLWINRLDIIEKRAWFALGLLFNLWIAIFLIEKAVS